ncbi:hypothetical protein [Paenibacillus nasutitermitis]|uniref:Uncharacterized protein n=1 Tax=Paenibacillus nasutitermitis TaxID=1652958 RepID=A0A916YJA5_9BACL|nr:hypothetical protein [Paenibacillus nasutitermitis]GGD47831.1 hypothetical protein GCM10010911_01700 [Paenibacillus nasutitermitis]
MAENSAIPGKAPKWAAVIVTEYTFNSHADVILGRLLGDLRRGLKWPPFIRTRFRRTT